MIVPYVSDMIQIVWVPDTQPAIPIDPSLAMHQNKIDLSKNMRLRICHAGATEEPQEFKTSESYEEKVVDAELAEQLGLPASYIGLTILVYVGKETQPVPFAYSTDTYAAGESSSSTNNRGLICPTEAFEVDNSQPVYVDLPGRMGGPAMNDENYLTYPGAGEDIPGAVQASSST